MGPTVVLVPLFIHGQLGISDALKLLGVQNALYCADRFKSSVQPRGRSMKYKMVSTPHTHDVGSELQIGIEPDQSTGARLMRMPTQL